MTRFGSGARAARRVGALPQRLSAGWWLCLCAFPVLSFAQASPAEEAEDETDVVTIVGRKSKVARITGSAHVVDEEALSTHEHDDIHRVLGKVPGVYVRDEDGFGLRPNIGLRGASSDRSAKVTLMEDGVLLAPAPYAAPAAYYFPITTRMDGVEVFKGPASVRHGPNTIGGAVNLRTRPVPRREAGGLDLAYGEFDSRKVHGFWGDDLGGGAGLVAEVVRLDSDGFKVIDGGADTGFEKAEAMLKMRYETDPEAFVYNRFELKLGYATETSNETYLGLTDADFEATPYRRYAASQLGELEWTRTQAQLRYDGDIGNDVHLSAVGYRNDFTRAWRKADECGGESLAIVLADGAKSACYKPLTGDGSGGEALLLGTNDRDYISQGIQLEGEWRARSGILRNTLTVGARLHYDEVHRTRDETVYRMDSGVLIPGGEPARTRDETGSATAWAFHVLDEVALWKRWYLTPGLRVELIDTRLDAPGVPDVTADEAVVIPGVGTYFQWTRWLGLLAGVHRGFSPVTPSSRAGDDEAPALPENPSSPRADGGEAPSPEESLNYEGGARLRTEHTHGELIGFFNDYSNLTGTCTNSQACPSSQVGRQFSAGRVYVYGAELVAGQTFGLPAEIDLTIDVTYTLTLSDIRDKALIPFWGRESEKGDALPYVPVHQGQVALGLAAPRWGTSFAASYVGEMRDKPGQGSVPHDELIEAHTVLDAAAYYEVTDRARLYAKADNLLDTIYAVGRRPFGLRPGKPRQVWAGFKYRFGE